jgi:hypothetical protein
MKRESHAPLIVAIVLLVLPVQYVGSYLALVIPGGQFDVTIMHEGRAIKTYPEAAYRMGGSFAKKVFWPVEQIDRQVRPGAWRGDDSTIGHVRTV